MDFSEALRVRTNVDPKALPLTERGEVAEWGGRDIGIRRGGKDKGETDAHVYMRDW
jgi:hypothetical protein